jgi:transposase
LALCDNRAVTSTPENLPEEIAALQAALAAERTARQEAEARACGAEAMVAHLKLLIAKLRREQYGQSSERGRKLLDQLELQLEEAAAAAAEDELAAAPPTGTAIGPFTRRKPVRAPFPAHLRRERVVIPARPPAPAAAASWPSSARRSPRRWRSCRGSGR